MYTRTFDKLFTNVPAVCHMPLTFKSSAIKNEMMSQHKSKPNDWLIIMLMNFKLDYSDDIDRR